MNFQAPTKGPDSLTDGTDSESTTSSAPELPTYDLCQVKDEKGRTILHLAAMKPQKSSTFYKMIAQCSYLIAERDENYRTLRDVSDCVTRDIFSNTNGVSV